MANLQSDNMSVVTARCGIAIAGMSRFGCAPTNANRLEADGTLKNQRPLPNDGDPDDTTNSWTRVRD